MAHALTLPANCLALLIDPAPATGRMMNLQAVETLLRYFLVLREGQSTAFPKVGDTQADETFATNYTSLGELIDVYNVGLTAEEAHRFKVDTQIVHIRDAFAHGRLVTEKEFPATLWKFGRAKNGKVAIEFSETLTEEWLKNANKRYRHEAPTSRSRD